MEPTSTHCKVCDNQTSSLCSRCKGCYYCSRECQKADWKDHKKFCFPFDADEKLREISKTLKAEDFEVYREIGEGNFSKIILVEYTKTGKRYSMKVVSKIKLKNLRKELDVLHEKLCIYRIMDGDRGKLPEPQSKVEELPADSSIEVDTVFNVVQYLPLSSLTYKFDKILVVGNFIKQNLYIKF